MPADQVWTSIEHRFEETHPTASGHFPGNPILPGAVLLDEVLRAIVLNCQRQARPVEVRAAKFLAPVRPGDRVTIRWARVRDREIKFECLVGENRACLTGLIILQGGTQ